MMRSIPVVSYDGEKVTWGNTQYTTCQAPASRFSFYDDVRFMTSDQSEKTLLVRRYVFPSGEVFRKERAHLLLNVCLADKTNREAEQARRTVLIRNRNIGRLEKQLSIHCQKKRELESLLLPLNLPRASSEKGKISIYTVSELPSNAFTECYSLHYVVSNPRFSFLSRVMAGINLAETVFTLECHFGSLLSSLQPNNFLVNLHSGKVYCFLDPWLTQSQIYRPGEGRYYPPEWHDGNKEMTLSALYYFLAVAEFQILCADDPIDNEVTLFKYPCLTRETEKQIYGSQNHFVFDAKKENNSISGRQWRLYPRYLRDLFVQAFTDGFREPKSRPTAKTWLLALRKLRDYLVFVNKQLRIINPDAPTSGLYLVIQPYIIPVRARKALYWYHIGLSKNHPLAAENGIIGTLNAEQQLKNHCDSPWEVQVHGQPKRYIQPDESITLEENMKLLLPNKTTAIVKRVTN